MKKLRLHFWRMPFLFFALLVLVIGWLAIVDRAESQLSIAGTQTGYIVSVDSLAVGAQGERIREISTGTVSVDPPSIATVTRGSVTFTLTGAAVGDVVDLVPPSTLNDDLIFHHADVTGADTVTIYIYNPTAGAIDDTAKTWRWLWFDLT